MYRRAAGGGAALACDPVADHDADLRLALDLADLADAQTMARFGAADLRVESKADRSPVTEADRAAETVMRDHLARHRPDDGVLGEEQGETTGGSGRRWILDPIDGTRSYTRGLPVFATLIALEHAGQVSVGVVSAPALRARWWAARGGGAFRDGTPLRVSAVDRLERAYLSTTDPLAFRDARRVAGYPALAARCWTARALGDFWSHVLVAEGRVDVAVEPVAEVYDLAPLRLIVEEAGGRFTDLSGAARIDGGDAVSSNGLLHDEVLRLLEVEDGD